MVSAAPGGGICCRVVDQLSRQLRYINGSIKLTGALGLITTVGGNAPPCLEGVAAPLGDCPRLAGSNRSGAPPCAAAAPDPWPCKPRLPRSPTPPCPPALFGGRGLFRISLRVVVEEEGVKLGDCVSREPLEEGDAAPSLDSLFFLEDLLSPLPRESCEWLRLEGYNGSCIGLEVKRCRA